MIYSEVTLAQHKPEKIKLVRKKKDEHKNKKTKTHAAK